ncbi:MAG TPA: type II secretion system protein [Casimicrobiaceae bacterium]|nr:type II secretion system protein [Casimicrobiaceae bacterium]
MRHDRQRGFSLLEVLAAFVILALIATALFQLFSGALANAGASSEWSRAILVAESRLAAAANAVPLVETTDQGTDDDGRIRWQSRTSVWEPTDVEPELLKISEAMTTRLYRVEVDVRFPGLAGSDRSLTLSTLRLAAKGLP